MILYHLSSSSGDLTQNYLLTLSYAYTYTSKKNWVIGNTAELKEENGIFTLIGKYLMVMIVHMEFLHIPFFFGITLHFVGS